METAIATAHDGSEAVYESKRKAAGGVKDVYFAPDRSYVVGFYRKDIGTKGVERLESIVNNYRQRIFNKEGGAYWKERILLPEKIVRDENGRIGVVVPFYPERFFFQKGNVQGKEKKSSWYTKPIARQLLDTTEKGTLKTFIMASIQLSRIVKKLHAMGLSHSDLSSNNVLVDAENSKVLLIDNDGLVVPDKYAPEVLGTPEFIAPEVYTTIDLPVHDAAKNTPSRNTDLHALAVLIYMYLLKRHPLLGQKVHDVNPDKDNELAMGTKALFIEHPSDASNRSIQEDKYQPWCDTQRMPYTMMGKPLQKLFEQAFITGLHVPSQRPIANAWEAGLTQTYNLLQPCGNPTCEEKWFVLNSQKQATCPYCGWQLSGVFPLMSFYTFDSRKKRYVATQKQLLIHHEQFLYAWHTFSNVTLSELLTDTQKQPMGYFSFYQNDWWFINMRLDEMQEVTSGKKKIPFQKGVVLKDRMMLQFAQPPYGLLGVIQLLTL